MKRKLFLAVFVGLLVIFIGVQNQPVEAKQENPSQVNKPDIAGRPAKLDRIIFVHPVAPAKPDKPGGGKKPPKEDPPTEDPSKDNSYYELWGGFLASTAEYYVNPNVGLVTGGDPVATVNAAFETWDTVTADELFSYAGTTEKSWYEEDGQNTISWVKFVPRENLAMAVMWYDPETMIIYEFDIVFNTFHRWGINPTRKDRAYDIQNVATHEVGHPTGLGDLYGETYSELTMFGYSSKGETEKFSLEEGDILGAESRYSIPWD